MLHVLQVSELSIGHLPRVLVDDDIGPQPPALRAITPYDGCGGQWGPWRACGACLAMGALQTLRLRLQALTGADSDCYVAEVTLDMHALMSPLRSGMLLARPLLVQGAGCSVDAAGCRLSTAQAAGVGRFRGSVA
jgi:hypothetical protein